MPRTTEELYEYKISSLLEVTETINSSFDEDSLYELYKSKLKGLVDLEAMTLFVYQDGWRRKVHFGVSCKLTKEEHNFRQFDDITLLEGEQYKNWPFDVIFPIVHRGHRVAFVLLKFQDAKQDQNQLSFIRSLSSIVLVALENQRIQEQKILQHDLEMELAIASNVQNLLVPHTLPKTDLIEMNSTYIPQRLIGGDYFDYIEENDNQFLVCIADVSGKGVSAALLMSNFQATLKALVKQHLDLKDIVKELNSTVFEITGGERFITAFFAVYYKDTQTLRYINAGHNAPFYLDRDKKVQEKLSTGSTLLGAFEELPFINEDSLHVVDYSMLFMYTDGLVEIFDDYGIEFGEIGLEHFLRHEQTHSLEELHEKLLDLILSFSTAGYQDDITILSCKFRY